MNDLKKKLIRLGKTNPDLRKHLRPVLSALKESSGLVPFLDPVILDNDKPRIKFLRGLREGEVFVAGSLRKQEIIDAAADIGMQVEVFEPPMGAIPFIVKRK